MDYSKLYNIESFKKLLTINNGRYTRGDYSWLTFAKALAQAGVSYQSKWVDLHKEKYKDLWPLNIQDQHTYNNCVDTQFFITNDNISMLVIVCDGNNLHGYTEKERCHFEFEIKDWYEEFKTIIHNLFEGEVRARVEEEERLRLLQLDNKVRFQIFNSIVG